MPQRINTFVIDVKRMRDAQNRYFKTKDIKDLKDARILEKKVDEDLKQIFLQEEQFNMLDMLDKYE